MVEHTHYFQKKTRKDKESTCELKLSSDDNKIHYWSRFFSEFLRVHLKNSMIFTYLMTIDKKTGDIEIYYQIESNGDNKSIKTGAWTKNSLRAIPKGGRGFVNC